MKILGIVGTAGSGKSTLANLLINCGWHPTKFASPLKSMLTNLLKYQGVDIMTANRMIEGDLKEVPTPFLNNRTPRHAMQTLGTEWRDLIDRNLWVDVWVRSLHNYPINCKVLVDDCRFHHEANAIRGMDGKIVRIERPNNPHQSTVIVSSHISETQSAEIIPDITITNDSHPAKMLDELAIFLEYWK